MFFFYARAKICLERKMVAGKGNAVETPPTKWDSNPRQADKIYRETGENKY